MPTKLRLRDRLKRALHLERQNRTAADSPPGGFSPNLTKTTPLPPPTIAPGSVDTAAATTTTTTTTTTSAGAVPHVLPTPQITPPTTPHVAPITHPLRQVRSRSSTSTGTPLGAGLPGALYDEPDTSEHDLLQTVESQNTETSTPSSIPFGTKLLVPPPHEPVQGVTPPFVTTSPPAERASEHVNKSVDTRGYGDLDDSPEVEAGTLTPVVPVTTTLRGKNDVLYVKDNAVDPTAGQDIAGLAHPGDWEVPVRLDSTKPADSEEAVVGVEPESVDTRREREAMEGLAQRLRRESMKRRRDGLMHPTQPVEVAPMGVPSPMIDRRISAAPSSVYDDEARREYAFEEEEDVVDAHCAHRASSYAAAAGLTPHSTPPHSVPVLDANFIATHTVESTQEPLTPPTHSPPQDVHHQTGFDKSVISGTTPVNAPPSPSPSPTNSVTTTTSSITHRTHHTVKTAAPVTIERVIPVQKEIVNKEITREIHTSEIRPIIQPVLKTEYLPAQHIVIMPDGSRVEITEEEALRQGWDEVDRRDVVVGRTGGLAEQGVELGASDTPVEQQRRLGVVVGDGEGAHDERLDRAFDEKVDAAFARVRGKGKEGRMVDEGYAGVESGKIEGLGTGQKRLVVLSGPHAEVGLSTQVEKMRLSGRADEGRALTDEEKKEMEEMDEARRRSIGVAV